MKKCYPPQDIFYDKNVTHPRIFSIEKMKKCYPSQDIFYEKNVTHSRIFSHEKNVTDLRKFLYFLDSRNDPATGEFMRIPRRERAHSSMDRTTAKLFRIVATL